MKSRRATIRINGVSNYEVLDAPISEKIHQTLKSAIDAVTGAGFAFTLLFPETESN